MTSYMCFMASEPIAAYLQGQTGLATGFDESPVCDVYAHMDCMRQSRHPLARLVQDEAIKLATLDSHALRQISFDMLDTDPRAYEAIGYLTCLEGLEGMPDFLSPIYPLTIH